MGFMGPGSWERPGGNVADAGESTGAALLQPPSAAAKQRDTHNKSDVQGRRGRDHAGNMRGSLHAFSSLDSTESTESKGWFAADLWVNFAPLGCKAPCI